jgi:hypothetical protein
MLSSTLSDRRYVTRPKHAGGYVNVTCHPNLHLYSAIVQAPLLSIFSVPQRTTEIALERRSVSKSTPMPKSDELALLDAINSASPIRTRIVLIDICTENAQARQLACDKLLVGHK